MPRFTLPIVRPRPPRNHFEAHPRIDVREARRHVLLSENRVLWRDQRGRVLGTGAVSIGDGVMTLHLELRPLPGHPDRSSVHQFAFNVAARAAGGNDYTTICPGCSRSVRVIVLVEDSWGCSTCQRLGYRSEMIGSVSRQTELLQRLEYEVGEGRPKGMHETTYQSKRMKLAEVKAKLGDLRLTTSTSFAEIVTSYWQKPGPTLTGTP